MTDSSKVRVTKYSTIQKESLVDFMELNPKMRGGKFTKEFTAKMSENLWKQLTELLNSLPGSQKDINQWRKTWQDLKSTVKEKCALINKESHKTGGGRPTAVSLTSLEERVKSLIGDTVINGQVDIPESITNMNWGRTQNTGSAPKRANVGNTGTIESDTSREPPTTTNSTRPTSDLDSLVNDEGQTSSTSGGSQDDGINHSVNYLRDILSTTPVRRMTANQAVSPTQSVSHTVHQNLRAAESPHSVHRVHGAHSQSQSNRNTPHLSSNSNVSGASRATNDLSSRRRPASTNQRSLSPENLNIFFNSPDRECNNHQPGKVRRVATQRLEKTIEATDKLIVALERETAIKKNITKTNWN